MKKSSKWILVAVTLLILLNLIPFVGHSQSAIGSIDPLGDVDAPFDGGMIFFIAIGIAYGIRKATIERGKKLPV